MQLPLNVLDHTVVWPHGKGSTLFEDRSSGFQDERCCNVLPFSSYVRFDIIQRILSRVFGCTVVMVMGITDVDDKIIRRANEVSEGHAEQGFDR